MKKSTLHKGFTLIELLVVVAIIGLLAATILASLGQARSKAKLARAQSEISSMRAAAELYYSQHGSYESTGDPLFEEVSTGMSKLVSSVTAAAGGESNVTKVSSPEVWAFSAVFGDDSYCADSNGYSGKGTATQTGCTQ